MTDMPAVLICVIGGADAKSDNLFSGSCGNDFDSCY